MNWFFRWGFSSVQAPTRRIPLDSLCPACGHAGCTLRCLPPGEAPVGEKGKVQTSAPMIERKCNTCGALAYEKTVVEPEKWVGK